MATWDFLKPWLNVLSPRLTVVPHADWKPHRTGTTPPPTRLLVNAFPVYRRIGEPEPPYRPIGRAIEIVTLALRVDAQVWEMLRGRICSDMNRHTPPEMPLYAVFGHDFFRHEGIAVGWELAVQMIRMTALTEDQLGILKTSFCEDDDSDDDEADATVSAAAYRVAIARIRQLNVFRADLDDPVAITIVLLVDAGATSLVSDAVAAIVSNSRARFRFTGVTFELDGCGPSISDLFQRANGIPIDQLFVQQSMKPIDVCDVLTAVEATPIPNIELFLGHGEMLAVFKRLCAVRADKLGVTIHCFWPDTLLRIRQAVQQAEEAMDVSESSIEPCLDNGNGDVDRLELTLGPPFNMTDEFNVDGEVIDPLDVAAQLWGRRCTCRLKQPALLQRIQETSVQAQQVTMATRFDCIQGNDTSVAFLAIPSANEFLRVSSSAVEIATSTPCRIPLPRWLATVRSLYVHHTGYMKFLGLPRLLYLFPSLVSLSLSPWLLTWESILPRILLSLPSSLEYLKLEGSADSPSHLLALFQAYDENGIRVRSLHMEFEKSRSLLTLLTKMADPACSMASHLEKLTVKFECPSLGEDAEPVAHAIEQTLATNERLGHFHIYGKFPCEVRDLWRVKASPFDQTVLPGGIGSRIPRVCTLALVSVVCHYEYAVDTSVLSNIVAYAHGGLVLIAVISSPDGVQSTQVQA